MIDISSYHWFSRFYYQLSYLYNKLITSNSFYLMNHLRSSFVFLLLIGLAFSQSCCDDNTFQIGGNADVSIKPDRATINIQVTDQANTSSAALTLVNQQIDSVINLLKQNGLNSSDYSTSSININPKYEYQFNQNVLVGQEASQTLSVVIKNIDSNGGKIGAIIDDVSSINGITINGINFDQSDSNLGKTAARKAAFQSAQKKAQ